MVGFFGDTSRIMPHKTRIPIRFGIVVLIKRTIKICGNFGRWFMGWLCGVEYPEFINAGVIATLPCFGSVRWRICNVNVNKPQTLNTPQWPFFMRDDKMVIS